jgi:hypothetical protein
MVSDLVERNRTEEPDAGVPHVRICGEGAGQPVPLPRVCLADYHLIISRDLNYSIREL